MSADLVQMPDQNLNSAGVEIRGVKGLSRADLERELAAGARYVFYEYCISLIVVTLRRPSAVYFLRGGSRGVLRGLPYVLLSLLLGWWGVPWGIIYTPLALVTDLTGGCDVTAQMRSLLQQPPEGSTGPA